MVAVVEGDGDDDDDGDSDHDGESCSDGDGGSDGDNDSDGHDDEILMEMGTEYESALLSLSLSPLTLRLVTAVSLRRARSTHRTTHPGTTSTGSL